MTAFLRISGVSKTFVSHDSGRESVEVLNDISFELARGEMLAVLGPSGAGKSTLLRCVAGLDDPDRGEIGIDGTVVFSAARRFSMPPRQRDLGMIFQNYALWPHMTVWENVAYPLRVRRFPKADQTERVDQYLATVGCLQLKDRYPHELSGGQQQRVSLARALVYEPRLVLFDEPLSSLDASLREEVRYHIRNAKRQVAYTGIYVTHDQSEAFSLGDKVAIILAGQLKQFGSPEAVYSRPGSVEVASFLGCSNWIRGQLTPQDGMLRLMAEGELGTFDVVDAGGIGLITAAEVIVGTRPEDTVFVDSADDGLSGIVGEVLNYGASVEYVVQLEQGVTWRARVRRADAWPLPGARVRVRPRRGGALVFPVKSGGS